MATEERSTAADADGADGEMRARRWVVAANFGDPAEYGIPELPDWEVCREDGALVVSDGGTFLRAESPVRVRR